MSARGALLLGSAALTLFVGWVGNEAWQNHRLKTRLIAECPSHNVVETLDEKWVCLP